MSVADTFFPWIILVCFIVSTFLGYIAGKRR